MSKESSGTQPKKCTNEPRQEPWLAARLALGRLPVIPSVKVVIKDSSFLLSGMAGTAGLTEGCRWNNAAVGYAGHPDGPGRSHVCRHILSGGGYSELLPSREQADPTAWTTLAHLQRPPPRIQVHRRYRLLPGRPDPVCAVHGEAWGPEDIRQITPTPGQGACLRSILANEYRIVERS